MLKGLETLDLRIRRHCENARKIADYLQTRPELVRVRYPGLATHPQHELAASQMSDFGSCRNPTSVMRQVRAADGSPDRDIAPLQVRGGFVGSPRSCEHFRSAAEYADRVFQVLSASPRH